MDKQAILQYVKTLEYIRTEKIRMVDDAIAFYQRVGAHKDLSGLQRDKAELEQEAANLENVIKNGPKPKNPIKVSITAHGDKAYIVTHDVEEFDEEFFPHGNGRIGCQLNDVKRLGMSKEAEEFISRLKRVGDDIGDLTWSKDHISWIGGPVRVLDVHSVKNNAFEMPVGYAVIPNGSSPDVEEKENSKTVIKYEDYPHELWIEMSTPGSWKDNGNGKSSYTREKYFTLENMEGARFVTRGVYDDSIEVTEAPEGMLLEEYGGTQVKLPSAVKSEIFDLVKGIFGKRDESTWRIKIPQDEVMFHVNRMFDLGFDNNVMNPREGYWRMAIVGTVAEIKQKLELLQQK